MSSPPILEVTDLKKHFPIHKGVFGRVSGQVFAVDGVSFTIGRGETLGLVGESGCGKSTVGRTLLKLLEPTGGTIKVSGEDITGLDPQAMLPYRRRLQMISSRSRCAAQRVRPGEDRRPDRRAHQG